MKYKHRYIQQIKDKYGVPELHFFRATKPRLGNDYERSYGECFVCSLDEDIDKKYRQSEKELCITSRLTHHELEDLLKTLACNSRAIVKGYPTIHKVVLLEPSGIEINDLISLKSAYLLTYLAGI